jgi:hypothetical protein
MSTDMTTEQVPESPDGEEAHEAPPPRPARRPIDMFRAMVVLLIPVILLVLLYKFLGNDTPPTVDTAPAYEAAQAAHSFDVVTPQRLPKGWHISAATYDEGALRLGLNAADGGTLRLVESATDPATLLPAELGGSAHPDGTVPVSGRPWQRYVGGRPGEVAIVRTDSPRTIIVVGKSDGTDLTTLAGSLA